MAAVAARGLLGQLSCIRGSEKSGCRVMTRSEKRVRFLFLGPDGRDQRRSCKEVDATEQHDQGEALERATCPRRLEIVAEKADPDQERHERVDDHQSALRSRDGTG